MKRSVLFPSLAAAAAALALAGAVRSATASAAIAHRTEGLVEAQRRMMIMVTPEVAKNEINLSQSKGIDVAIIYEPSWSFSDIDPQTIEFAKAIPAKSSFKSKDWDNDGQADRIYTFTAKDLKLTEADTLACMTLELINKTKLTGCDKVKVLKSGSH